MNTDSTRRTWARSKVVAFFLCTMLACAVTAGAATTIRVFSLESIKTGKKHGPFQYLPNAPVQIEAERFQVTIKKRGSVAFLSVATRQSFGPYDFVEGRIIRIGGTLFTLTEIRKMAYTPPVAPSEPKRKTKPVPIAPAPARKPLESPPATALVAPSGAEVPARVVKPEAPRIPRRSARAERSPLEIGVSLGLLRSTEYEWKIDGASDSVDTTINRNTVSFHLKKQRLSLNGGFTLDSHNNEDIDGDDITFRDVKLDDGLGWWLGIAGDIPVWRSGSWCASIIGDVYHMSEVYTAKYSAWTRTSSVVQTEGTNGTEETVFTYDLQDLEEEVTIAETLGRIGGKIEYQRASWSWFSALRLTIFDDTDVSGGISASSGTYGMSLERTGVASIVGGVSFERRGLKWSAEGEAGADMAVSFGVSRTF
jgi:hypothetical protein